MKYLWDTNTVIYYLQQQLPRNAEVFIDKLVLIEKPIISVITEIELLSWNSATAEDMQVINDFIDAAHLIELTKDIRVQASLIRRTTKIKLPDAVIAATALINNLNLISRNNSDFSKVEGLGLIDLWQV